MCDRRGFLSCLHSFLLLATIFTFFSMVHVSYAQVINVPQDYPTIQQAIDAAGAGDTINVSRRSGESQSVYYERLSVNKQLILVGENRETIIIDGGGAGTVIRIQADNVEVRGFTIRNGGQYSGIRATSYSYVTIANNTIKTSKYGVSLADSNDNTIAQNLLLSNSAAGISLSESIGNNISDNNVYGESAYGIKLSSTNATFVVKNTVADSSYGIYLGYSSNDTVDKNTLLGNGVDGIFPHACHDIIVSNNEVSESAYAIQLYNSDTITVLGNNATDNDYGIYLAYSGPSNTFENNTISGNTWGITLYDSSSNTFKGNTLSYNTYGVDPVTESNNNLLYHNNFVENIVEQVIWNPNCVNTWDDGYPSGGNYWSDYEEKYPDAEELDGSGIWDTAYIIDPMNKDRYPLMNPLGGVHDIAVINVTPSALEVYVGEMVDITVVAENQGTWTETFNVIAYYNETAFETQTVTSLPPNTDATLTYTWNTTSVSSGLYIISATAEPVSGETAEDMLDNTFTDGTVLLVLLGDVNDDGMVDMQDMYIVVSAFGTKPGEPKWDPRADLAPVWMLIDFADVMVVVNDFGKT